MTDLKELRAIADDLTFAAQKLDGVDGLESLPQIVSDTHKLNKDLKNLKPASIISNSLFGLLLGAAIGTFAAYHFAKPIDLASTGYGINVMHDQAGNATFYFQRGVWHAYTQDTHHVLQLIPARQQTAVQKAGQALVDRLDKK